MDREISPTYFKELAKAKKIQIAEETEKYIAEKTEEIIPKMLEFMELNCQEDKIIFVFLAQETSDVSFRKNYFTIKENYVNKVSERIRDFFNSKKFKTYLSYYPEIALTIKWE